jgi:hypothetical protein
VFVVVARSTVVLAALTVIALRGPPARAQTASMSPEAKQHLESGLRHYNVQSYAEAIAEFKAGYELEPRPEFLYALGQAQRLSGDCAAAIASYEAFLRTLPPARQAAPAREQLERCRAERAAAPAPAPPAPVPPAPVPPAPPPSVTAPAAVAVAPPAETPAPAAGRAPLYKRWWFWTAVAGVIATGVGVAAATGALRQTRDASCPSGRECLTP